MGEWWQTFFDEKYFDVGFRPIKRRKTLADVRFITKALALKQRSSILDVCCGVGRHTIELSKKGYRVTGIDFNDAYLDIARKRARRRGLEPRFERYDVRRLPYKSRFDAAVCMWTSFGYFEKEADDLKALRLIHRSLKAGGVFLIELMNRDWLIANFEPLGWVELKDGYLLERRNLDSLNSRIHGEWTHVRGAEVTKKEMSLRVYSVHELVGLLETAGFRMVKLYGGREERTPTWRDRMSAVLAVKRNPKPSAKG